MRYIISILVSIVLVSSCKNTIKEPVDTDTYYTCSMDPQVVEYKPGTCPICKMDLTPVKKRKGESQGELELSDQQIQLGNIQVDTIRNGTIGDQLILTASLNFDQSKLYAVSSRVMGRVEKLYFKNLGEYVKKGAPLYEIYSEDLNNAKQEYLLAVDKKNAFSDQTIIDFDQLIQSAKNKLLLWGLNETQINELGSTKKASPITTYYSTASGYITELDIREGDYVMEGGTIVKLADLSTLWVEAQVYTSQLGDLQENSMVSVQLPDFNNREIKGKLEFVNPEINQATRINLVRIPIPNPGNYLKPGMSAYVLLKSPRRKSLSLPIDAVVRDGKGATVWVQTGKNTFKNLMVQTGLESDDRIEIISGLSEGDIVVLQGAYLLHSEYVFKKGANPMEGMKM